MAESEGAASARAAIVEAAARLLSDGGPTAMTTRRVAQDAGVQAPTIYRLFGDKDGLLEAVAEHVMTASVSAKAAAVEATSAADTDPLDDLWDSWRRQIDFGLDNPAVFRLLSDPDRVVESAAAHRGRKVLAARLHRLAEAGRLRVPESRAIDLIQAAGIGTIQALLATPTDHRDPALGDAMLTAVLGAILTDSSDVDRADLSQAVVPAAVSLRALAPHLDVLSDAEQRLLIEWLDRIVGARDRERPDHVGRPAPPGDC